MTQVKICGITSWMDAAMALEAGADMLGLIFYSPSSRSVTAEQGCRIVEQVRGMGARFPAVGVFVDEDIEVVRRIARACHLDAVQLHGEEPPEEVDALREDGLDVFKVVRVRDEGSLETMGHYRPTAYLLETYVPDRHGGTGQTFDWTLAAGAKAYGPILLAGGLTPDNVAQAVDAVGPWGVDVASGVESAPGRKDGRKVRRFVSAAKGGAGGSAVRTPAVPAGARPGQGRRMRERGLADVRATRHLPDERGYFGGFGGKFVPETLMPALQELDQAYGEAQADASFRRELEGLLADYVGRPTPLTFASRLTAFCGGAAIYLKREDLAHTGAHKINNTLGQGLLARRMGKRRVVAETGAGQHGVATATAAALLDMDCVVYMGTEDVRRQAPNVARMELLGAEVRPVDTGSCTLKDAINEAIRDWVTNVGDSHYLLGSVLGPHPYPLMVRDFQAVIGYEARRQILAQRGRLPDVLVACVGGGSNAMGLFHAFRDDPVKLVGVEAGGLGIDSGRHAARFGDPRSGRLGVLHGTRTFVLQDGDGQIQPTHSISAGLDYPAVGPEHCHLRELERATYTFATDEEALGAFELLCRLEGIIPALESAHAVAEAIRRAGRMAAEEMILVNLSGRGDKDLDNVAAAQRERAS